MKYTVPYTNVGKGGILHINGKHYHTPSWTEVTEQTTLDDIIIEPRPMTVTSPVRLRARAVTRFIPYDEVRTVFTATVGVI